MPQLAMLAPYIGMAVSAAGAVSSMEAGQGALANAELLALQDERDANATEVEAQNVAAQERRKARFLRSRAIAVAGASGGGVADPTVENLLTDIDTEGEMSALNALYSGDIEARALRHHARAQRAEGVARRSAYFGQATGQLADGFLKYGSQVQAPTFFSKYGSGYSSQVAQQALGTGYAFDVTGGG